MGMQGACDAAILCAEGQWREKRRGSEEGPVGLLAVRLEISQHQAREATVR